MYVVDLSDFTSLALRVEVCTTTPSLYGAGNLTLGFVCAR